MSDAPAPSTMRRDIVSAYVLTVVRVLVAVIIAGAIYRWYRPRYFAGYNLVKSTVLLLNYASFGLLPAMIHHLARADRERTPPLTIPTLPDGNSSLLTYETPRPLQDRATTVIVTGYHIAALGGLLALMLALVYTSYVSSVHRITADSWQGWMRMLTDLRGLAFCFGLGVVFRVFSEPAAAILQTRGHIALDNYLLTASELLWLMLAIAMLPRDGSESTVPAAMGFLISSMFLRLIRGLMARRFAPNINADWEFVDLRVAWSMLTYGSLVFVVYVAEYLYAPIDFMLINWFVGDAALTAYAPAVQIDAGLLLLVTALAAVVMPKSALAHAAGDRDLLRRYYVHGTIVSLFVLTFAAVVVWLLADWIFQLWLASPMHASQAILPLVLIHTVVGGSSAVGRSILLGMGKVKPFTISVLIAGVANVVLSVVFVRFFDLGLRGIVYGTIIAVVGRAGIWMPLYVLRVLRESRPQ